MLEKRDESVASSSELEYEKYIWANLNRNYIASFVHGMLGLTGFRIVFAPTFIPAYLHLLAVSAPWFVPFGWAIFAGPDAIVGLGMSLLQVGAIFSPIVGASFMEHRRHILPVAIALGTLMRLQFFGMAIAGWLLYPQLPAELLVTLMVLLCLLGIFMGTQRVAFQLLLSKVIPISRRGRLQAWRNVSGGLIAAGLSWVAGEYFIGENWFGNGYSTTFLFVFVVTSLGLTALQILSREPVPPTVRIPTKLKDRVRDLPKLLIGDRDFGFFIIAQTFAVAGRIAAPFYILFVRHTIELTGSNIGLISLAYLGADTLTNLIWGYLGDKSGFRSILIISIVLGILSTLLLMSANSAFMIFAAFFGLGASVSGYLMSVQTMVLEFGQRDDIAMRLALSTTAEGLIQAIGPLVGGVIASVLGYTTLFTVSIAFEITALFILFVLVKEPRLRKQH